MGCSRNDCDRVYHLSCAVGLSDISWSYEGRLVCPQHVSYFIGFTIVFISVFSSLVKIVVSSDKSIAVVASWGVLL